MIRRALAAIRHRLGPGSPPPNLKDHPFSIAGRCNVCGADTTFRCADKVLDRETLTCGVCLATSRYRSMARGVLQAIRELTGIEAASLAELERRKRPGDASGLRHAGAVPCHDLCLPSTGTACGAAMDRSRDLALQTGQTPGTRLDGRTSIQNLEALTFPDASFDIVLTSDVMEHVRLHDRAHAEIARVVKPGGVYMFTVPHYRHQRETYYRVQIVNPDDPSTDIYLARRSITAIRTRRTGWRSAIAPSAPTSTKI